MTQSRAQSPVSPLKRREIIDALRIGSVPRRGLELFAVGIDRFEKALTEELDSVAAGQGKFKAVRGEYGTGKTFFAHWLCHLAQAKGFATATVQISETDTPLYRMETIYRRALESLQTTAWTDGAFRSLIDGWFFSLEDAVLESGKVDGNDPDALAQAVGQLLEERLGAVGANQPQFAAALRACHAARVRGDHATAEGLVGWLMGQPNIGAGIKRAANLKGEVDHFLAGGFIRGVLEVLKQSGHKGLVLVLDEVETIQRVRADSREKSLEALRKLLDELVGGRYPGLYVLITGTPKFFDGPQGVQRTPALAQRLHTDFDADPKFDSARAPQIRLQPFSLERMVEVGRKVRDLFPSEAPERVSERVTDETLKDLAEGVAGALGGKIGIAPRIYLKRLIGMLDRVDQHPDYDPKLHHKLVIEARELTEEELAASGQSRTVDDIALDLGPSSNEMADEDEGPA
ncbi:MAG: BREX system ATP-binding protein BrxD [Myxococcales bacterium]|nr:BREX system ATP-binding protein BrxD [Myxococcales bacterium]